MEMIWNTRLQVIFVIFSAKFEIAAPIRMDETRSIFRELNTFTWELHLQKTLKL